MHVIDTLHHRQTVHLCYIFGVGKPASSPDQLGSTEGLNATQLTTSNNITTNSFRIDVAIMGSAQWVTYYRYPEGDLYIDTTVTETVEGTPEDYTYTTEEVTPVEVTVNDDYDFTEFVPSTQFDYYEGTNKLYQLAKVKRRYYKDGVVIPESSITDFGSTKYYKNIVTTKYWKEITTGSKELEYYCYMNTTHEWVWTGYVYAPIDLSDLYGNIQNFQCLQVNNASELTSFTDLGIGSHPPFQNLTVDSVQIDGNILNVPKWQTYPRYREGDLYKDTTTTTVVEGTPEDYTYTTEETEIIEVSANEDYDYTEFVPSTQFDYYTDRLLSYEIIKGVK